MGGPEPLTGTRVASAVVGAGRAPISLEAITETVKCGAETAVVGASVGPLEVAVSPQHALEAGSDSG